MKKLTAAALAAMMMGSVCTPVFAADSAALRGDVDGNGRVDLRDAMAIARESDRTTVGMYERGALLDMLTDAQYSIGDVDGDGALTLRDAYLVIRYYDFNENLKRDTSWDEIIEMFG